MMNQIFAYSKKILLIKRLYWKGWLIEIGCLLFLMYISFSTVPNIKSDTNTATVLLILAVFLSTLQGLYQDKTNNMMEFLRIMGLSKKSYICSYIIVETLFGLLLIFVSALFSIRYKDYDIFQTINFIFVCFIFLITNIVMAFLMASIISNSRFASFIGIMIYIVSSSIYEIINTLNYRKFWFQFVYYGMPYYHFNKNLEYIYDSN